MRLGAIFVFEHRNSFGPDDIGYRIIRVFQVGYAPGSE
jgi:hypothetical protein